MSPVFFVENSVEEDFVFHYDLFITRHMLLYMSAPKDHNVSRDQRNKKGGSYLCSTWF